MDEIANLFKTEGEELLMTVNTPFILDQSEKIWFLEEGGVNIYTVQMSDAQAEGKRFYFFEVRAGEIIMGLDSQKSETQLALSADATEDTRLYVLPLETFKTYFKREGLKLAISRLVDRWVESIFYGLSINEDFPNQQADVLVKAGERLILRHGESIASQRRLIWGKINRKKLNSLSINGGGQLEEWSEDVLLPLSRRSFWQADRNLGIRFYETLEALEFEGSWSGLRALDEGILQLEKQDLLAGDAREEKRLKAKYEQEFRQGQRVLREAQAVLNPKLINKYESQLKVESDHSLFNACQVLAAQLQIKLILPDQISEVDPLGDIVRHSQIRSREILLKGEWWKKEWGPLLGFWGEEAEPVALIPNKKGNYEIYHPAEHRVEELSAENASQIDSLAYTFFTPFPNRPLNIGDILRFAFQKDYRDVFLLISMGFLASVVGLLGPIMTGVLFDNVIPNASLNQVLEISLALLLAFLGGILFELTEGFALLRVESKMDWRLQAAVWDRLLKLPVSFFKQFNSGDLANRALGISEIRRVLSGVVVSSILGGVFSLLNFALLFYYSLSLASLALFLVFIEFSIIYWIGRQQVKRERVYLEKTGAVQGLVLQLLLGISKFRVTGAENRAFNRWLGLYNQARKQHYEALKWENWQLALNYFNPLVFSAIIYAALIQSQIPLSTGEFLAFNAAFGAFTAAVLSMSEAFLKINQIFPLYERTQSILESVPEVDTSKANPGKLKGNIEINKVNFRYDEESPYVLENISFRFEAGDYVALVGASGSGKSTLVRLLLGFETPSSGSIFYDEQELGQLDLGLLRRQIGTVLQNGQLIPGDIFSNIVGTSPHLSMDDAWEAAKLAALDEDIKKMPMAMHTVIGEGSNTLSGGQKQRLLIARTLVHKPRILIFDEATSALDNQTQSIITQSLNKLQATRIIIAHRLSTIKEVDKVLVMERGRLVQAGTYEELMQKAGPFRELAKRQIE